ncbi:MAG: cytochrome c oxidase subunit I [Bryobacterales bacterium]|nr:cytochrome c oxidase subunit I [Bryobacterales bacterium]
MADTVATPKAHGHGEHHDVDYLHDGSLLSWMTTVDHKKLGVMYLWSVLFMFFLGGVFALLIRMELFSSDPSKAMMDAQTYNKVFTLHGAIMVFLFIIPSIPAALGNFVLPIMLGAKDVAFPRLNLASFWVYVTGALIAVTAMVTGGVDTGWTFYTPYSTTTDGSVALMTFAAFVLGFSSILTGVNFIATVHKLRAPGMGWFKMPLFVWGMYATAIIQVLATPVLAITLLLLIMERTFGVGVFDPKLGGDPVLFQHFFWFYSHPAVYIMILPGMAIISEVIPTMSQKTFFGYKATAFSSVAIAIVSFVVWGHHMFTSGQSQLAGAIFSFLTFLVGIPSAIKVFNWITTMYKGSISLEAPMLYALMFLILFGIGGLTGLFLGAMSVDIHLHDTYFVVAHFHYVMMGSTAIAFLAGLHYWWPKMFGRMYNESAARIAAVLVFIGFNTTFLPQFLLGSRGMPRRYYNYLPEFTFLHQVSTVGSWILALGFIIMAGYLFASLRKKFDAPANPWHGRSLEWQIASPPITHNFHEVPVVTAEPYDYYRPFEPSVKGHH